MTIKDAMGRRRVGMTLLMLALLILLAEAGARRLLPAPPDAFDIKRNAFRFRAWPEYAQGLLRVPADVAICVIISNSQGYSGEHPVERTYPYMLERLLNERGVAGHARWTVVNLSSDGITVAELRTLAEFVAQRAPTVTLAVTGLADYAEAQTGQGFLYCRSDIPRMLFRDGLWRQMPADFWRDHGRVEDTLRVWANERMALRRWIEYKWSWLEVRWPGIHETFYAPGINYVPWMQRGPRLSEPLRALGGGVVEADPEYGDRSRELLDSYLAGLARIPAPVIVVSQSVRPSETRRQEKHMRVFREDLKRTCARHRLPAVDLIDAMREEHFISSSHLDRSGHPEYAERLAAVIEARLATDVSGGTPPADDIRGIAPD